MRLVSNASVTTVWRKASHVSKCCVHMCMSVHCFQTGKPSKVIWGLVYFYSTEEKKQLANILSIHSEWLFFPLNNEDFSGANKNKNNNDHIWLLFCNFWLQANEFSLIFLKVFYWLKKICEINLTDFGKDRFGVNEKKIYVTLSD